MAGMRFRVEKSYTVPGRGVVVSGKIEEGRVAVGQAVGFPGADGQWTLTRIMAIEAGHRLVEEAEGEQKASLLLEGVRKKQIAGGTVLQEPPASMVAEAAPQGRPTSEPEVMASQSRRPERRPPADVFSGEAIHPSSSAWRTLIFILIGVFVILGILFFQGKWDPMKRRTESSRFHVALVKNMDLRT